MSPSKTTSARLTSKPRAARRGTVRPARRALRPDDIAMHPAAQPLSAAKAARASAALPRTRRNFVLAARPDTVDFRDLMYVTTLVEVPRERPLAQFLELRLPVLDQGREGACTGFGLATVVHYLLRARRVSGAPAAQRTERRFNAVQVSPHMLYRMARRYDEWSGEDDDGSSARGAMKGWHRHGVCDLERWPKAGRGSSADLLTNPRAENALGRPLGGYFRVNHRDIVAMHAALSEVGILYATAWTHAGWDDVKRDGIIPFVRERDGGHAFAIVAYDLAGFWIQNSWDTDWGRRGFGHISYDDWLRHGSDVWVARLGAPVGLEDKLTAGAAATGPATSGAKTPLSLTELRSHVISIGNNGVLRTRGTLGTDAGAVDVLFRQDFPRLTETWPRKRLLIYAHGGLVHEDGALQRVQDYRKALMEAQVYPLAFIWKTDYWTTLTNALEDAQDKRKPEGFLDRTRDFMLNRLDDTLEPIARLGTGKLEWDEMKENGVLATAAADGGARIAAHYIAELAKQGVEIHVAGHSAGSILMGPLVRLLGTAGAIGSGPLTGSTGHGVPIKTCSLWAPACTIDLFQDCYRPLIDGGQIERFALFTLTDDAEQCDNCARVYNKSLLYLVSHAFEARMRNPLWPIRKNHPEDLEKAGVPILGMEWWVDRDPRVKNYFTRVESITGAEPRAVWVRSPNTAPEGHADASTAQHHGDFDDDIPTVKATLARILGNEKKAGAVRLTFDHSESSNRDRRERIMEQTRIR